MWRNAYSLDVLRGEVETLAPGTAFQTIGDTAHQAEASDHNPNAEGVVCAADIFADAGLDLDWLATTITITVPIALKYVIWRDQIWTRYAAWQRYSGDYHTHVHVSVGRGPDGDSTGPYDDYSPWGLLPTTPPTGSEDEVKDIIPLGVFQQDKNPGSGIFYAWIYQNQVCVANTVAGPAMFPLLQAQGFDTANIVHVEDIRRVGVLVDTDV